MIWFLSVTSFLLFFLLGFTHVRVYLTEKNNPPEGQFAQINRLKIHYVEKGKAKPNQKK